MSESPQDNFNKFYALASLVLSVIAGVLIGIPIAMMVPAPDQAFSLTHLLVVAAFAVFGGIAGYRNRKSHLYFYFVLVAVLVLAGLVSSSAVKPPVAF